MTKPFEFYGLEYSKGISHGVTLLDSEGLSNGINIFYLLLYTTAL